MFTLNSDDNRITPVVAKSFSSLGFTERKHLQEWLAYRPEALGEELLIIQKEFDGFDDTKERLDLLALDKDGNLVIIENKLDDSGRDVVWQALKYASYCATLTKLQIVEVFQQYLMRYQQGGDAHSILCEFFDVPDIDELKLNIGNSQRLMLVAANFRKEVTSTAIWLLGQSISVQCFKVTPYTLGEQLLLSIDQIIPIPEAKELMIGISAKEAEEKSTEVVLKNRHTVRRAYWGQALDTFQNSQCGLYSNISPSKDHWLSAGSGLSNCPYSLIFAQKEMRVELVLGRASMEENKFLFDQLFLHKDKIEQVFGHPIEWLRLDDKKSSRIQYSMVADGFNKELWPKWIVWHVEQMTKFELALREPLKGAGTALKKYITSE